MWSEKYKDCLSYIENYWKTIIHKSSLNSKEYISKSNPNALILPFDYITPNNSKFNYIFYWDTFFIFKGLIDTKYEKIMDKMIKNFSYLFEVYGIIPNFNSLAALNRSQPPFLTSMISDTYLNNRRRGGFINFLKKMTSPIHGKQFKRCLDIAKREYYSVWIDEKNVFNHHVDGFGLSRYGDRDIGYAHTSELESGWDFTSRFFNSCNHFLPIDLNIYLYKYESDFMNIYESLNDNKEMEFWQKKVISRKKEINKYMWNDHEGFYFDYSWYLNKQSNFLSLAGFTPLWAGMADSIQADKMLKRLNEFETESGLAVTTKKSQIKNIKVEKLSEWLIPVFKDMITPKQWDYPNIWPPLEYLTIIGLLRYGYIDEAKRIMTNSIITHASLFRKYGTFFEKINSETREPGISFQYESQSGFGWTNAIFYRYIKILDVLDKKENIYKQPKPMYPPYELAIIH